MKIVVSGAAGFIGSNLCEKLLAQGHKVIGLDNFDTYYARDIKEYNLSLMKINSEFSFVEGDITDSAAIEMAFGGGADLVVHLAARAGVRPSLADPIGYSHANINGTLMILEAMKKHGITNMVFASSSSVYGNSRTVPFRETDFVDHPVSPYAATKKSCELLCHTYAHLFGMRIAALRFFTVYGRRQRPDLAIAKFTRLIDTGREIPFYGDGSTERDYTYIDDILDGILKSAEWLDSTAAGTCEVFNLGESRTTTLHNLVEMIEKGLGKKAVKEMLPMQPGDVLRTFADISRARTVLGYNPGTGISEGIDKYIMYYRETLASHPGLFT